MVAAPHITRFAPSPTGLLHLGNVRTALFNHLIARGGNGRFLLRLEDTDAVRGREEYARALLEDLRWLELAWDEGPEVGGPGGPYAQSKRGEIYARYLDTLQRRDLVYPCFCTEQELAVSRKTQLAAGRPPRYDGRCSVLTNGDVRERMARGLPHTLRFRVADGERVDFEDLVRGPQSFETSDIGDFIVRRSDGTTAFFFCNAVDDALMGVTLVVRGEDHLTNTPRQLLILRALDLRAPRYAHIALVVGHDGAPLSKRTGSRSVQELREAGFLPLAITNYLARLGHSYGDNRLMSLAELAAAFDVAHLHKAPARFDEAQLMHWQREAVSQATDETLWRWMRASSSAGGGRIDEWVPRGEELAFVRAVRANVTMPMDAIIWAGSLYAESDVWDHEARAVIREAGKEFFRAALASLNGEPTDFQTYAAAVGRESGAKGKRLFMPLRAALTGEHAPGLKSHWRQGPEMEKIWSLLGGARVRRRIGKALELAN